MSAIPVIAIFDVGKTNKKLFLFNESYEIVWENSESFTEITDDDGDPCEDIVKLAGWVTSSLQEVLQLSQFAVQALNFSAYGASLIHLDEESRTIGFLYNYLKPFPAHLQQQFYQTYGEQEKIALETASPALGSLNSGLMFYRLKYDKPKLFRRIWYSLHLPQYLSYLVTRQVVSDVTSIGCHTMLWDYTKNQYHDWVRAEGFDQLFGPIFTSDRVLKATFFDHPMKVGVGMHDSSAALIPYLISFQEPFVLISTGTWSISLNPFNTSPLTAEELQYDCLCYLHYQGRPVKASRLFAGYEHEQQAKRLAAHFQVPVDYYKQVAYDPALIDYLRRSRPDAGNHFEKVKAPPLQESLFGYRDLTVFATYEEAYHQLMLDLVSQQLISTDLVLENSPVKRIFVDGGFSKNPIYMALLAQAFPETEVFAASVAQATALGAALAIHHHWNTNDLPENCIQLKQYTSNGPIAQ
ncbi:FGGY-family carbohydrate kinase [Tellurirhabdus bombi]|uniref:FGGY-family carbohydrate kinase n=1 Tax=Tellurirhabdus bombi TaxID=2907205 RepID=UPI001EFF42A2|nr:FGGY family carbohydrate kinase [Tellurirhabdus bombi]